MASQSKKILRGKQKHKPRKEAAAIFGVPSWNDLDMDSPGKLSLPWEDALLSSFLHTSHSSCPSPLILTLTHAPHPRGVLW